MRVTRRQAASPARPRGGRVPALSARAGRPISDMEFVTYGVRDAPAGATLGPRPARSSRSSGLVCTALARPGLVHAPSPWSRWRPELHAPGGARNGWRSRRSSETPTPYVAIRRVGVMRMKQRRLGGEAVPRDGLESPGSEQGRDLGVLERHHLRRPLELDAEGRPDWVLAHRNAHGDVRIRILHRRTSSADVAGVTVSATRWRFLPSRSPRAIRIAYVAPLACPRPARRLRPARHAG
jgi:hypothetical protein